MTWNFIGNSKLPFNGLNGVFGLPQPFVDLVGATDYNYYYLGLCVAVLAVVFIFAEYLRRGSFGRVLRAIREDQDAAQAFGRDPYRLQLKAFVLGSVIAGLGGGLLVGFTGALDPGGWTAGETLILLTAVFLGGSGNNLGVIVGMVLLSGVVSNAISFLPQVILKDTQQAPAQLMVYGVLLILILRFRPAGLIPESISRDKAPAPLEASPASVTRPA
jgi:ABC-type branched-subunit amino acid transport system permease subunit